LFCFFTEALRLLLVVGRTAVRPYPHLCWGLSVAEAVPSSLLEALGGLGRAFILA
jgi:hypothetical protein